MTARTKISLGQGIFSIPDVANILQIKQHKIRRVLKEYWDGRISKGIGEEYSWSIGKTRAVDFHTLIEFYMFFQLRESGIEVKKILEAHNQLAEIFKTKFPFANNKVLNGIKIVGKKIVFEFENKSIMDLNYSKQLNLDFVRKFWGKIDFDKEEIALRFWPIGKDKKIVIDPSHQFGQPTIYKTNILPRTIYSLYLAEEPIDFIAATFQLDELEVKHAIEYCKEAA